MKEVAISSKAIPASPRSKNYPAGSTVVRTGGGGTTVVQPGSGSALSGDILVSSPTTGCIQTGDLLKKGLTYEQIFRKMFVKNDAATLTGRISTSNDVEIGSAKGTLTYTATRNTQGVMKSAYYDNVESNALVFSAEVNGVQTATRVLTGNYAQNESYDAVVIYSASPDGKLPELTLSNRISVNVRRKWFAGVCSAIPTDSAQVRALSSGGLYAGAGAYKFQVDKFKTLAICIPFGDIKEITLTAYPGNFIEDTGVCKGPTLISVEGANGSEAIEYKMWIISTEMINDADTFTIKTV